MFPSLSTTVYTNSYSPGLFISTEPFTSTFDVKSPSSVSLAFIPDIKSNSVPSFIVMSSAPLITGKSLLITVTVIVLLVLAPPLSVTSYTTLYVPGTFVLTSLVITFIFDVMSPSSLSLAVTPLSGSKSSLTFIVLFSASIVGTLLYFVVSSKKLSILPVKKTSLGYP